MKNGQRGRKAAGDARDSEKPGSEDRAGGTPEKRAKIAGNKHSVELLRQNEERYRAFIKNSSEGIWCFELEEPIPIELPVAEQIRLAYTHGYLGECNDAMARQYGFEKAEDITGARLGNLLLEDDPGNLEYLKAFFESGYNLTDAESHELHRDGTDRYFLNNLVGQIEDGRLVRAWGTQRDVTDTRRTAEAAAHLAAIVTSSDDAIISKTLDGVITSWNRSAERVFGYTADEVLGRPITILMPQDRTHEEAEIIGRIKRGDRIEHYETVRRKKDGTEITVSLTVSPLRDASGNIVGASKIARDITEKRHADLIAEQYRELSMRARDIILFIDQATGRIVEANRSAEEAYGYARDEITSKMILDLRAPETLSDLSAQYATADERGIQFETVHKRKDGTHFPVEVSAMGSTVGGRRLIVSIIRDITERRRQEDALSQNQMMLALAMRGSRMGVWERDIATGTVWWSEELEEIFGLEKGGFSGSEQHYYQLIHPDDREATWAEVENAIGEHRPYTIEFRFYHADGSVRWMEGRGEAVYSQNGQPVRLYGVGIDITDRKAVEEKVRFLAALERSVQQISSPDEIMATSSRMLCEYLGCSRCAYAEVENEDVFIITGDYTAGVPSIVGRWPVKAFGAECSRMMLENKPFVLFDTDSDSRIGPNDLPAYRAANIRAVICVPLHKQGKFTAAMAVHQSQPRIWTEDEVELVQRAVGRCWESLERSHTSRGLRESDERFRLALSSGAITVYEQDRELRYKWLFPESRYAPDLIGKTDIELTSEAEARVLTRLKTRVLETGITVREEVSANVQGEQLWYDLLIEPRHGPGGDVIGVGGTALDITVRKRAENRLALLAGISELIRIHENPADLLYAVSEAVGEHFLANRCLFNEIDLENDRETVHRDYFRGTASVAGVHRISEYSAVTSAEMIAGRTVINNDSETDPRTADEFHQIYEKTGERSYVTVPLLREGRWVASLWLSDDQPRQWSKQDVELLETIAERTWTAIERLRIDEALRVSRERLQLTTEAAQVGTWQWDIKTNQIYWSAVHKRMWGYEPTDGPVDYEEWARLVNKEDLLLAEAAIARAFRGEGDYEAEYRVSPIGKEEICWIRSTGRVDWDDNREPLRLQGVSLDITHRKRAEELLRKSARQLALVTDTAPVYLAQCDAETRFRFVNKAYADRFGLTPDECVGKLISEVIGDHAYEAFRNYVDQVLAGQRVEFDAEIPYKDIGRHLMHCSYEPELNEAGKVVGFVAAITDISERKKIEDALRESEERFSKAFNSSPLSLTISSLKTGKLIEVNSTFVEVTGYSREEAIGKTTVELGLWADTKDRDAEMAQVLAQGQVRNLEYEFVVRDGSRLTGLLSAERIDMGGEHFALTVIQDITARKQAEEALLKAERKAADEYQQLLERIVPLGQTLGTARGLPAIYRSILGFIQTSMPCSAFFVSFFDAETRMRSAGFAWGEQGEVDTSHLPPMELTEDGGPNSQAVYGRKAVIVDRYMDFMKNRPHIVVQENGTDPNSSLAVPMVVMDRVIGTIEVQAYERNAFKQEHVVALEMVANLAAAAIENVRLIEIEAKALSEAEAANRMKDEFLSILSHELRTPLNAMLGWVRMLRAGMLDAEKSKKGLEVIERNTRQQSSLIEDLLDVSRIISGKMRIEKELVDFASIVRDVSESMRPLAASKTIDLEFRGAEEPAFVDGDAVRLLQVMTNLVQNAIKFTPTGGRIKVALSRDKSTVAVTVSDTGVGIDANFLPYIFDRFSQADASTKRTFTGLGLGLTIVGNIVELHGGSVTAESDGRDRGAGFTVTLPLAESLIAESLPALVASENGDGHTLDGIKVLVIDDDTESIVPIQLFLESERAVVSVAVSASEALRKLSDTEFDIVISDIGMPAIDGYELIRRLRSGDAKNSSVAAIAVTAYASADDRTQALEAGFQSHLPKPVNFEDLLTAIKEASQNRER